MEHVVLGDAYGAFSAWSFNSAARFSTWQLIKQHTPQQPLGVGRGGKWEITGGPGRNSTRSIRGRDNIPRQTGWWSKSWGLSVGESCASPRRSQRRKRNPQPKTTERMNATHSRFFEKIHPQWRATMRLTWDLHPPGRSGGRSSWLQIGWAPAIGHCVRLRSEPPDTLC